MIRVVLNCLAVVFSLATLVMQALILYSMRRTFQTWKKAFNAQELELESLKRAVFPALRVDRKQ